ncbi:MAG: hypothetical protein C4341_08670 [Armatimonadota bacterium]
MTRLNIPLSLLAVALLVAGCGSSTTTAADGEGAKQANGVGGTEASGEATETIGTLTGPGGSVSLGDAPEKFEAAFPRPEGATPPQNPPSIKGATFAGWQTNQELTAAVVEGGKISVLIRQLQTDESTWVEDARKKYGKPTREVSNALGTFAHWSAKGREHAVMLQKGPSPIAIQVIGESATLTKMGFDASQFAAELKAAGEAAASQGHSPDDGHGH